MDTATAINAVPALTRGKDPWFPDGNLVIQAENILYCVYRGILAKHSPFFSDMLSIPQPSDQESYEGNPVVRLPESADHVAHFLSALYNPFYCERGVLADCEVIASILHLSTKYQVHALRARALAQLQDTFPHTLEGWDNRQESRMIRPTPQLPFQVVKLARELKLWRVLPAALYGCAIAPIDTILDRAPWGAINVTIDPGDQRLLLVAREALAEETQNALWRFLRDDARCSESSVCERGRARMYSKLRVSVSQSCMVLTQSIDWVEYEKTVCKRCLPLDKDKFEDARRRVWDRLPSIFKLPSWYGLAALED